MGCGRRKWDMARAPTAAHPEREQVISWRTERLRATGLDPAVAIRVASDERFDLHALLELVDRGCPPELAVRILAPLEEPGPC
jgi:hypothetical protein